jgi:hypothetical protein
VTLPLNMFLVSVRSAYLLHLCTNCIVKISLDVWAIYSSSMRVIKTFTFIHFRSEFHLNWSQTPVRSPTPTSTPNMAFDLRLRHARGNRH